MPRRIRVVGRRRVSRRIRVAGSRVQAYSSASLRFETLEIRRLLHAGHDHADDPATLPFFSEPVPGDVVLPLGAEPLNSLSSIPMLNSNPGAPVDIYLDFDGHFEAAWGSYTHASTPVYSRDSDLGTFSNSELQAIHDIWAQVSEDYAPFNVNVTTVEPPSFADGVALRIAIGGNGEWYPSNVGGVAYVNSFTSWIPNTAFVFSANLSNGNPKSVAEASSHEAGHAFGLEHISQYNSSGQKVAEYYAGAGGKAPIMGNSYSATRGLWWNGPNSDGPNSIQDDMARIARSANGFGYRLDDHGNTPATATLLSGAGGQLTASGIITTTSDLDYFAFDTDAGEITLTVTVPPHNNLDARLELRTATGELLQYAAPSTSFGATITANLQAGSYRAVVMSQGNYGDVGQYTLTADVLAPSVEGVVFVDHDRDGVRDDGEPGIPGVTVFDDLNRNGQWDAQPQLVFTALDTPLAFPASGTTRSYLVIEHVAGLIVDVNVRVSISHPHVGDLLVGLIDPLGTFTTLAAELPNSGTTFTSTVFDDQAEVSIYEAIAPFTGRFRPLGELSPLAGRNPNGQWRLIVTNLTGAAPGVIDDFSLEITVSAPEPKTTTDSLGRYLFAFSDSGLHHIRQMPIAGYVVGFLPGGAHQIMLQMGTAYTHVNFANLTPGVVDRALFYDGSKFDGYTPGINAADDLAIATDKRAYLPGAGLATFDSISSYVRGLNGIMIDVLGLNTAISFDDFQFRMGDDNDPHNWLPAPLPSSIDVRAGAGVGGSDRIELVWADDAVKNAWLQVTLAGNDAHGEFNFNTGMAASDVFYFGSRVGDAGFNPELVVMTGLDDELAVRAASSFNQLVTNPLDFNRDGVIGLADQLIARNNPGLLMKINLPGAGGELLAANAVASALAIADRREDAAVMAVAPDERTADVALATLVAVRVSKASESAETPSRITLVEQSLVELVVDEALLDALLG